MSEMYVSTKLLKQGSNYAIVRIGQWQCLFSYETLVCSFNSYNGYRRHWDDWSRTTARHIRQFADFLHEPEINLCKAAWEALPCAPFTLDIED